MTLKTILFRTCVYILFHIFPNLANSQYFSGDGFKYYYQYLGFNSSPWGEKYYAYLKTDSFVLDSFKGNIYFYKSYSKLYILDKRELAPLVLDTNFWIVDSIGIVFSGKHRHMSGALIAANKQRLWLKNNKIGDNVYLTSYNDKLEQVIDTLVIDSIVNRIYFNENRRVYNLSCTKIRNKVAGRFIEGIGFDWILGNSLSHNPYPHWSNSLLLVCDSLQAKYWSASEKLPGYDTLIISPNCTWEKLSDEFRTFHTAEITDIEPVTIKVYPNPASNLLYIDEAENANVYMTEITDLGGRVLINSGVEKSIDISVLKSGMYLLHRYSNHGSQTVRFLINR